MNILVIGSGGREHALIDSLSKSTHTEKLFAIPGNPGTAHHAINVEIDPMDNQSLLKFCKLENIKLVIPGSEVYLQNGISDYLSKENIHVFGPTKKAANIESSKQFAKDLMEKYEIPTAKYCVFNEYKQALKYLDEVGVPIVIKYDGLAGGKGVVVAKEYEEAKLALIDMLEHKIYGNDSVIIEEFLEGLEFSLMCFVDKGKVYPMPISQDHKRLFENDLGPNTGGMGAYSSVPIIPDYIVDESILLIMQKVVDALSQEKIEYTGFLYGGLMYTEKGPYVIEFNARLGDPETEVILPRLESDIVQIILDLKNHKTPVIEWSEDYILGVVMASLGYPKTYHVGQLIKGINEVDSIYHMGTIKNDCNIFTNGGRVLFVYGRGKTLLDAKNRAYHNLAKINCKNLVYRKDIGNKSFR